MGDGMGQTVLCTKRYRCQENNSIDLLHDKSTFIRKMVTAFLRPPLGAQGATYAVHLRLIEKLVVDFLLVVIELFSLGAFILSQFMRLTDGRTDGQKLIGRPRLHSCSAVW